MKKLKKWCSKQMMRRIVSALLAVVLSLGILPASLVTSAEQWTNEHIDTLVSWGVMRGDDSGNMNPDKPVTRAEFVAMVNRAFGYTADTAHPFTDVLIQDWYNNDIGIAYNMGYFKGTSETTASPNSFLTREQAVVLIGRNLLLDEKLGETLGFSDSRTFSEWSRGMVESAISSGFIGGYEDGSFKPQQNATRGEIAAMLSKAIGTMVNKSGTHELGGVYGNVMISTSGVKLKNTTIAGDLYITGGLELGDVLLENVNVLGKIVISGTGESHKGDSSIVLRNVESGELVVNSIAGQFVTLRAEGNTQIDFTNVKTSAYLDDQTAVGDGLLYIELNGQNGMNVSLAGNIEEVLNRTPESALMIAEGTAQIVTMDEKAVNSTLNIQNIASINTLNLDIATPVTGEGDVKNVFINAAGSVVDMLPDQITIRPGLKAEVNGEEMDTKEGNESSAEPRILSGYPKLKNLAPNSVEVVYSANKKGTIHWALTSLIDGPVKAEDLLEVKDYNTKILQQGTINVTEANKEFKIKITNLLSDGSYYVTAVLVDNRDQMSPVKYLVFTTPDGTAPAFAAGYPELTQITSTNAQVTVMPTKSSILYYAVLPKGASAPTIAEFKTGSVSGDLGSCFTNGNNGIEVKKNKPLPIMITEEVEVNGKKVGKLEELKSYDLYLCLIDPDNGKDSGVKKISFSTVDGTPPIVADAIFTGAQKNNVTVTTSMNEVGTIYWVVVDLNADFLPKGILPGQKYDASAGEETANLMKKAILQIVNGMGGVIGAGKASAKADTDVQLKINGLKPATAYDVYYIGQDKADNNSEVIKKITVTTQDDVAPTVYQQFTRPGEQKPLPDTDVKLIFSENVRHADSETSFLDLYTAVKNATSDTVREAAKKKLAAELAKTIVFYDRSIAGVEKVVEHDPTAGLPDSAHRTDAWINFENVTMEILPTKELCVFFKTGEAIGLNSGGVYQFVLNYVIDTSSSKNPMQNPMELPEFETAYAQVLLSNGYETPGNPHKRDSDGMVTDTSIVPEMSFKMNPRSTDNVNVNILYDVWVGRTGDLGSDLYFDLYCRIVDQDGNINADGTMSMFAGSEDYQINKDNDKFNDPDGNNGWIYLGNQKINRTGTGRVSLFDLIYAKQPSASLPQLVTLKSDCTYEFAIKVTQFQGITDENSWNGTVELEMFIPADQTLRSSYVSYPDPWEKVSNIAIGDCTDDHPFIPKRAPYFLMGSPSFAVGDSVAEMTVIPNRACTLHYVISPVVVSPQDETDKKILTPTIVLDNKNGQEVDFLGWYAQNLPEDGTQIDPEHPLGEKYTMTEPSSSNVRDYVIDGVYDKRVLTNKVSVVKGSNPILIEGLSAETTYIVYCVLEGESESGVESGVLSNVYCFQFTTRQVDVPAIELRLENGITFKTTTPAILDWAIYPSLTLSKMPPMSDFFQSHVENGKKVDGMTYEEYCDKLSLDPTKVTVIEALMTSISSTDDRSLFDLFAKVNTRQKVQEYVQRKDDTNYTPTEYGGLTFDYDNQEQVYTPQKLEPDTTYYVVAVARNKLGKIYGFKAIGGLRVSDETKPELIGNKVTFVPGDAGKIIDRNHIGPYSWDNYEEAIYGDNPGGYAYSGELTLNFTEEIYCMLPQPDFSTKPEPVDTEFLRQHLECNGGVMIDAPIGSTTDFGVSVTGSEITIKLIHAKVGTSITFFAEGPISDKSSNVRGKLILEFVIEYKTETKIENGKKVEVQVAKPTFKIEWSNN